MKFNIVALAFIASTFLACHSSHEHDETHAEQKEVKFQYTAYSANFELFAEADAFILGKEANVLSHFSILPDFKAVESGSITIVLTINGKEVRQKLDKPTRKGIFSFNITPETAGKGTLKFEISNERGNFVVDVPEVSVFSEIEEAAQVASKIIVSQTNATFFTKEQSWKVDFATGFPLTEPFGQVIKATALVQSSQVNEVVISSKTNGIVLFNSGAVLEGRDVSAGQSLFSISGSTLSENNISVKYAEAKNNYERTRADYDRAKELAKDKIVSEKDLLSAKNQYENTKAVFDNLNKNFNASGQTITSPQAGFIKQVFVKNGAYVEAGQPVVVISQNKSLVLSTEVPSKFAPILANIQTANIRTINENLSFSLEQLNGKILSYGKATNTDNFLIPVNLQVDNNGSFVSGSFVEVYLKTFTNSTTVTVPNEALLEEQGSFFVWVQVHPELFEKREVAIGGNDGLKTEIRKGINSTDRIVTRGAMLIKLAQATGTLDAHSGHVH
jgi:RND family efflux transporter MFP subunit